MRLLDLVREAGLSVVGHPGRSMLTAIGIILGSAAFVATLGVSTTLSNQVSTSFDARRATEVVVQPADEEAGSVAVPGWQGSAAVDRLRRLNGVAGAGQRLSLPEQPVSRSLAAAGEATSVKGEATSVKVAGVEPGAFDVIEPKLALGRTFDAYHDRTAAAVVLLPRAVADSLSITRVGVAIFVNGRAYTVMGIFDEVNRQPATLAQVVMPFSTAQALTASPTAGHAKRDVVVRVEPGAARLIAGQAPYALAPEAPDTLESIAPPDPQTLRREVEGDVANLAIILSLVALAIGTVSIGNAATAGIAARTAEIGLRRAIGARPRHIFTQLLAETTALGAFGGLLGAAAGVVAIVAISLGNNWQPVVDIRIALAAAGSGIVTGLVAGLLPGWRATRIQPVAALQR
jgi:putative ABC transport system permease protein